MTTSDVDLLQDTMAKTQSLIGAVEPAQLSLSTPCEQFTVGQLINHLGGWAASFASRLNSVPSEADPNAYVAGSDPADDFANCAEQIVSAYRLQLPPAKELPIGILLMEYVTHGWDLAVASGQRAEFTDQAARAALAAGKSMLPPDSRGEGKSFGSQVATAPGDTALQELVAFLGRDPHWTPAL